MKLKEFIQNEVLVPRLRERGVLVVYDAERRYQELCWELAAPGRCVVDAGQSSILAREAALAALQELGRPNGAVRELLVYVPAGPPLSDEEKQRDPFALYEACGAVFPAGDGDEYADGEARLPEQGRSQEGLLDLYVGSLCDVDRRQREFEQAAGDLLDRRGPIAAVLAPARAAYRRLVGRVQELFIKHLEKSGWPLAGRLALGDVFDQRVAPRLQEGGRRVAYLLIDALRYELGVELQ